jgi:hypothetical protein
MRLVSPAAVYFVGGSKAIICVDKPVDLENPDSVIVSERSPPPVFSSSSGISHPCLCVSQHQSFSFLLFGGHVLPLEMVFSPFPFPSLFLLIFQIIF